MGKASKRPRLESIPVNATVEIDELVNTLYTSMSHEELLKFIKDIDDRVCELEFTVNLRDHFRDLVRKERGPRAKKLKPDPVLATKFAHLPAIHGEGTACGLIAGARMAGLLRRGNQFCWDGDQFELCPKCVERAKGEDND